MEEHSSDGDKKAGNRKRLEVVLVYLRGYLRYFIDHAPNFLFCARITCLSLFLIYIAIPIFVKSNKWILPKVVFSNIVRWPPFINLSNPSDFGLNNTRNFRLEVEEGVNLGAWHILPDSLQKSPQHIHWEKYEDTLNDGQLVFLYLHGNSGTRGSHHRVQLYKLLSKLDFHVLTIDYRGYGDSTGDPTENGVVTDAYFAYQWLKDRVGESKVFIWGHSLGTGITAKLAKKLCDEGDYPAGIVLESPFNNIQEAAFHHPFALPYRMLPWFEWIFLDAIGEHGIFFNSEENIMSVTPHILILHAKDDYIVPYHLGQKLYHRARDSRSDKTGEVEFESFEAHLGYGHKLIHKAPQLPDIIRKFVAKTK